MYTQKAFAEFPPKFFNRKSKFVYVKFKFGNFCCPFRADQIEVAAEQGQLGVQNQNRGHSDQTDVAAAGRVFGHARAAVGHRGQPHVLEAHDRRGGARVERQAGRGHQEERRKD
jgi:hypothetical protein